MDNMSYGQRKFKVGDKVRCVKSKGSLELLEIGGIYTVSKCYTRYGWVYLDLMETYEYYRSGWMYSRFVLVPNEPIVKSDWL